MRGIVDRIESSFAVIELEDGSFKDMALSDFKGQPAEGDTVDLASMTIIEDGFDKDDLSDIEQYFK